MNSVFRTNKVSVILLMRSHVLKGNDVAFILDYRRTKQTLRVNVFDDGTTNVEELVVHKARVLLNSTLDRNDKNTHILMTRVFAH